MPLYNKSAYVLSSIASIQEQTVSDWELVVIDDGSTDDGPHKVLEINDSRIRLHRQSNAGVTAARNRGIDLASCELIAFLDADDVWKPGFLACILKLARDFPEAQWFGTGYEKHHIDGHVVPVRLNGLPTDFSQGIMQQYFFIAMRSDPPVCSSAMAVKREAILAVGGFPSGVKDGEDLLTWARLAVQFPLAYNIDRLACYQVSGIAREPDPEGCVSLALESLYKNFPSTPNLSEYIGLWYRMQAVKALKFQQTSFARQCSMRAFWYGPRQWRNAYTLVLSWLPGTLQQSIDRFLRQLVRA